MKAVVFDVGETLIDESGMWERAADAAGVPRFTLMGVLGGLAAHLHEPPAAAIRIRSLDELPGVLGG